MPKKAKKSTLSIPSVPRPTGDIDAEGYYDKIVAFLTDARTEITFSGLSGLQRKKVHDIAEQFKLLHESITNQAGKLVKLTKISIEEYKGAKKVF